MLFRSIIVSSFLIIPVLSGCVSTHEKDQPLAIQGLENIDISDLALAADCDKLSVTVMEMSVRKSSLSQKRKALKLALHAHSLDRNNEDAALALSVAAFLVADLTSDEDEMEKIANLGAHAALKAGAEKGDPIADYYYAVNLGLVVNAKGLAALSWVPDIKRALENSIKEPATDMGGPMRALGMLYLKAPPWPAGMGDLEKALEHLKKAATEFPDFPQNHMFYGQALMEDDENEDAIREFKAARGLAVSSKWGEDYERIWQKEIKGFLQELSDEE